MKYGLIGEKLGHSFSPEIHRLIGDYPYELKELPKSELASFMQAKDFCGINVTIPYKQAVIPYLDGLSDRAAAIGAVNTVINRNGRLIGDNTDFIGLQKLIERVIGTGRTLTDDTVLILGTGGTSLTARAVCTALGARRVFRVSRGGNEGALTYDEAYGMRDEVGLIINCTPCGMFPHQEDIPLHPADYRHLFGVVDCIYNPLRTRLVLEAKAAGVPAEGGLYMLTAQAVAAAECFFDTEYAEELTESIHQTLQNQKENIVLIGMPSCGKTTFGKIIAKKTKRSFWDTDCEIVKRDGRAIRDIIASCGEDEFRAVEEEVIAALAGEVRGAVIATGGGAILRDNNVRRLRQNGILLWIDRPLNELIATFDRPLSSDRASLEKRYHERFPRYLSVCDYRIDGQGTKNVVFERIKNALKDMIP